jgi:hypothetical membrane protein
MRDSRLHYLRQLSAYCGLIGVILISSGALFAALAYRGRLGEHYQLTNHFVSELGEVRVSELAWLFNANLVLGGACITLFMVGTAWVFRNFFSYIFGTTGLITGISGLLVGVFPMDTMQSHIKVAMLFFNMGLFTMAIFSIYVAFSRQQQFPKWFVVPGAFATLCFAAFLNFPSQSKTNQSSLEIYALLADNRPTIWFLAIMEWIVVIVVLVWVLMVSVYSLTTSQKN